MISELFAASQVGCALLQPEYLNKKGDRPVAFLLQLNFVNPVRQQTPSAVAAG